MGCCVRTVGQRQRHLVVRRPAPQLIAVLGILGVAADATGQDPAGALEMGQINGQAQRRLARALWETLNRRIQPTADSTTNANATPTVRAKTVDWSDGMLSPPIASPPFCLTPPCVTPPCVTPPCVTPPCVTFYQAPQYALMSDCGGYERLSKWQGERDSGLLTLHRG